MKKVILALFVIALAIAGAQIVNVYASDCGPSTAAVKTCPQVFHSAGNSRAIGSGLGDSYGSTSATLNKATYIGDCRAFKTNVGAGLSTFYFQKYASVATGAVWHGHIYSVNVTGETIHINDVFPVGGYAKMATGTVDLTCQIRK